MVEILNAILLQGVEPHPEADHAATARPIRLALSGKLLLIVVSCRFLSLAVPDKPS